MEEKILEILISMQKDITEIKQNVEILKQNYILMQKEIDQIKENQRIMKNNIAKILEKQNVINGEFENHKKQANLKFKEFDYRLTLQET